MTDKQKVKIKDILGLVKTDEVTNSVDLKKELYKSIGNRFIESATQNVDDDKINHYIYDMMKREYYTTYDEISTKKLCILVNQLNEENKQLKSDLIDHSALLSMLEDYQALKIEDTLWNLTGAESEEEFNELYKPYLEKAKKNWSKK